MLWTGIPEDLVPLIASFAGRPVGVVGFLDRPFMRAAADFPHVNQAVVFWRSSFYAHSYWKWREWRERNGGHIPVRPPVPWYLGNSKELNRNPYIRSVVPPQLAVYGPDLLRRHSSCRMISYGY